MSGGQGSSDSSQNTAARGAAQILPLRTNQQARRTWADFLFFALCALTLAYLLSGLLLPARRAGFPVTPLPAIDAKASNFTGAGFAPDAVFPSLLPPQLSAPVSFFGSWIGSDASTGTARSGWYRGAHRFSIFVAGYPNRPGIHLSVETKEGSHTQLIPVTIEGDPGVQWRLINITLPRKTPPAEFRILASDQATGWGGWIGISTPFFAGAMTTDTFKQLALLLCAIATAIVFFLSPGLLLRQFILATRARLIEFIWLPMPGLFVLIFLGLFAWIGPHRFTPGAISRTGLFVLFVFVVYRLGRVPLASYTSLLERKALLVLVVLVTIAASKATYSLGPAGELYRGSISRTLEVGDRSDSRISYVTAEIIALRQRPYSAFATSMLGPWNFSDRGPLAALAITPLMLAGPTKIPGTAPDQPWMIFDPEGFAAYRVGMITVACCGLLIVFGFSKCILPEGWAFFSYLIMVTAPFTIHEIYFTWPKLITASFVFFAAYHVIRCRYFLAGFFLGIGYLFHPSALLSTPALLGLILLRDTSRDFVAIMSRKIFTWIRRFAATLSGLAVWISIWRLINRKHFHQTGFILFYRQADRQIPTLGNWLLDRLNSLLNTIVPLNLFLFHRNEYFVNAVEGASAPVVEFFFQPWTGVPFGAGVLFFFCLLRIGFVAFAKARSWFILLIIVPFLFFIIYWGGASSGVLREGMHGWFLSLMVGAVVVLYRFPASVPGVFKLLNLAVIFRGLEILLMLLLPTMWTQRKIVQQQFVTSDVFSLIAMIAGTVWLTWFTFRYGEKLRATERQFNSQLTEPDRAIA